MFISKKKYEDDLHRAKIEVAEQWERKLCEQEKRLWEEQERCRMRDEYYRRMDELSRRVHELEKYAGFVEDTPTCPCAPKCTSY